MGGSSKTTIGYKYYMGMHMGVCHGPVDKVTKILVGERLAWEGDETSSGQIFINAPDLFGGEEKEGGVVGFVDLNFGDAAQTQNTYLQGQLGNDIPAYRGVLTLTLNQCYVTAMSPYPKPWAVQVTNSVAKGWYDEKALIAGGGDIPANSANPAHVIYDALTDTGGFGLGLAAGTFIDDVSFRAAADILYDENFGISWAVNDHIEIRKYIVNVLTHIGAVLYTDRTTGKYVLKLIRTPTTDELDNALVVNDNNIISVENYETPSMGEMINQIILTYHPQGEIEKATITVQDLASIQAQNGKISQTVSFAGIDNAVIATLVAERELRQYTTPLVKLELTLDRTAWGLNTGDIIKFSSDEEGINNLIVRVFSVDYGDFLDGTIVVEGTEDIYSLPSASYINKQESLWVDPAQAAEPVADSQLVELPYYEIETSFSDGDKSTFTNETAFLQVVSATPPITSTNYQLWLSPTTTIGDYKFDLNGTYTPNVVIDTAITIPTSDAVQVLTWSSNNGILPVVGDGIYGYLNNEIVLIQSYDVTLKTITIKRGLFDTIPTTHPINSRLYFTQDFSIFGRQQYIADPITETGDDIYARLLPRSSIDILDINSTSEQSLSFIGRQAKPYSPAKVQVNSNYFPELLNAGLGLPITWEHRDRTLQLDPTEAGFFDTGTALPETGVNYIVRIKGETDNLVHTSDNLSSSTTSYTYSITQERNDSGLTVQPADVILITTETGLATTNIAYDEILNTPKTMVTMGSDWATVSNTLNTYFVNGTTGVLTQGVGDINAWRTLNTVNPFNIKTGVTFISTDEAGTQSNWAINSTDAASVAAIDTLVYNVDDYRSTSDELLMVVTREEDLNFYCEGTAFRKVLHYFDIGIHVFTRSDITTPTVQSTRNTIESYITGEDGLLDNANEAVTSVPALESPHAILSTISPRPPWKVTAFGSMVYTIYRGSGSTSYNTSSKFLDINNILNSDITVYSNTRLRTNRSTISGSTISNVDTINAVTFAGRSNVADTEGVEWDTSSTSFKIINSSTGAQLSTHNYGSNIKAMTVDWVNSHIFIIRSDNLIVKMDYTAGTIATSSDPVGITPQILDTDLKVSQNWLYLFDRTGQKSYRIAKDLTGGWVETIFDADLELTYGFDLHIRADSSLILAKETLFDENGGTSSQQLLEKRQNGTVTVEVSAIRSDIESYQPYTHTIKRTGWGYNYGENYGA